jgi:6-phosphogluconate dehydrogenase (decarboxylating)
MVHNGIAGGLVQSYAEAFELLLAADPIKDAPALMESWTRGAVIRSRLLDVAVRTLHDDADLAETPGHLDDAGTAFVPAASTPSAASAAAAAQPSAAILTLTLW